jgi:hypothetical protein
MASIGGNANIAKVRLAIQGSNPADPGAGWGYVFVKADGLYMELPGGSVVGPFIASVGASIPPSGWISATEGWTYVSTDNPTGIFDATGDKRTVYQAGQRIVLTNDGNTIYGIITNVNQTLQSGNTRITFLHEINPASPTAALHLMASAAITATSYSPVKCPFGFPMDPTHWTLRVTDVTSRSVASGNQNTWYNPNAADQIVGHIGLWRLRYQVAFGSAKPNVTDQDVFVTLSTANNSESDLDFTAHVYISAGAAGGAAGYVEQTVYRSKVVALAAKTTLYLNLKSGRASTMGLYLNSISNSFSPMILEAECAYL